MAEETPRQAVSHVTVNGRRVAIYSPTPDLWQILFNFKDDLNNDDCPREDVRWAVVNAVISYCSDGGHLPFDDDGPHRFPLANWTERRLQLVSAILKTWDRSYYCNALFAGLVLGCARRIALELKIRMRFFDLIINPHPETMSKAFKDGLASAGVILPAKPEASTDGHNPPAENPTPGSEQPTSLDSRAVGFAHEMITKGEGINVSNVARLLGCERTKLYDLPGFMALVKKDRESREAARRRRPRGTKDRETGVVEAWEQDE